MTRFFFHIEHVKVLRDGVGSEHPNLNAAKLHAVKLFAERLALEPQTFWRSDVFQLTVSKADGLVLFTLDMIANMAPAVGGPSGDS